MLVYKPVDSPVYWRMLKVGINIYDHPPRMPDLPDAPHLCLWPAVKPTSAADPQRALGQSCSATRSHQRPFGLWISLWVKRVTAGACVVDCGSISGLKCQVQWRAWTHSSAKDDARVQRYRRLACPAGFAQGQAFVVEGRLLAADADDRGGT